MKKIYKSLLSLAVIALGFSNANAQVLNNTADWTNSSWSLTGTYDLASVLADPSTAGNFSYDDDNAGSGSTDIINAESPTIDLTSANTAGESLLSVAYQYNYNLGSVFDLEYYDFDLSSWVLWESIPDNSTTTSAWCANITAPVVISTDLDISSFTATQLSGFKYRLHYDASSLWGWGFCFNPPTIISTAPPTCPQPSALTATNITGTSATLGWTNNSSASTFNVEIGATGFTPTGTATDAGVANPYNITTLTAQTDYEYYVQADCGGGDMSAWTGPFAFTTPCAVVVPLYLQDFTTYLDPCWSEATGPLSGPTTPTTNSNWNSSAFANTGTDNGVKINLFTNNRSDWMISPMFDLSAGGYEVLIDVAVTNWNGTNVSAMGSDDEVHLMQSTDGGTTWTSLQLWNTGNTPSNTGDNIITDITSVTSSTVLFAMYATDGSVNDAEDYDFHFDNFQVRLQPACVAPSALTAANMTTTTVDLGWTENGTATSWNIELGLTGFSPTGTPTNTGVSNTFNATGLTAFTGYDFYVQADCGANQSTWVGPFNFTTLATCPAPTVLTATNVAATMADLGWTNNSSASTFNVEIGAAGFTPTGTATDAGVANPYNITTLTAQTDYEYYVQADCGGGDASVWVGPYAFTTPCVVEIAPWTEGFENAGTIPNCWSMTGGENWEFQNTGGFDHIGNNGTLTGTTVTNNYFAFVDASGTQAPAELYSPMIDVSALSYPMLSFYEISDNEGNANSQLDVEVWDGAAWNSVGTYNTNTNGWEKIEILLYGITFTGDAQVKFIFSELVPSNFYDDIAIDDVTIDEGPSCPNPTDLMTTWVDNDSVIVTWVAGFGETAWNVELGAVGFAPGTGAQITIDNITTNMTDTIGGLTELTDYEIYIQADCGADSSTWVGPVMFTTLPNCADVSNVSVIASGADSIVVSWLANAGETMWDAEIVASGAAVGTGTMQSITDTNVVFNGLMSGTTYDIYVRSDCGGSDQGQWVGPLTYTVGCTSLMPITLPFVEDFEAMTMTQIGDSLIYCGADKSWMFTTDNQIDGRVRVGSDAITALNGAGSMTMDVATSGTQTISYSDLTLDLSNYSASTDLAFSCKYMEHGDEFDPNDMVWIRGSNQDSWLQILSWNTNPGNGQMASVLEFDISNVLSTAGQAPSSTFQLRIGWEDNFPATSTTSSDGITFDDIRIEEVTCFTPSNLAVVDAMDDSLIIDWTSNGGETEWLVEYGPVGFTPGTGTMYSTTSNADTITLLTPGDVFDFYVAAYCGVGDTSNWFGPEVIATEVINDFTCDAIFLPADGSTSMFSNNGATQQPNENFSGNGHTVWFKTVVPASGHLAIGNCGTTVSTRIETFSYHVNCTDSLFSYPLASSSSNPWNCDGTSPAGVEVCGETANDTIFFSVSTFGTDGVFPITIWDLGYDAGTTVTGTTACAGDTIQLNGMVTGAVYQYTGVWEYPNPTVILNDTSAMTANFLLGNDSVQFVVLNTCMSDTANLVIELSTTPNTGIAIDPFDGCNTGDVYLPNGLTGSVDAGGTWTENTTTGLLANNVFIASGLSLGDYDFTYTVDNGVCPPASTVVTVTINDCVGIEEETNSSFSVYPNPNNGEFFIATNVEGTATVQIIDAQGKIIYNKSLNLNTNATSISLKDIEAGIYMIKIISETETSVRSLMIK